MYRTVDIMETTRKRSRTPEWRILFEDASALRGVVDAVSAVMQRVVFKVAKVEGFDTYMLICDGADVGMTCCVSARLHIDSLTINNGEEEEFQFCVECKHLAVAIDNPSCSHGSLVMEGHSDATIHVRMQDPEQRSHADCSELDTFVDAVKPIELNTLDFQIKIEIDLSKLREMIKKARKTHAEHVRIQIYLRDQGNKQQSLVIFSVKGDAYHCQKFSHETSKDEDGSLRVRAVADGDSNLEEVDELRPDFEGLFPVEKIDAFIKILPCRMITAAVMQGMPLMMTHRLGAGHSTTGDDSHIRFLIAPINEGD